MLAVGVVAFPPTACTVRSDEFLCEDAVAKIQGCCPRITYGLDACTYVEASCSHDAVFPGIGEPEARCIIAASCDQVRGGACGRAACP